MPPMGLPQASMGATRAGGHRDTSTGRDTSHRIIDKSLRLDSDGDSMVSFASGPHQPKKATKYAWGATDKVSKPG